MLNNSVYCCSRSFGFELVFRCCRCCRSGCCCSRSQSKITQIDKNRVWPRVCHCYQFYCVRSLITWSIITIMIQCFLQFSCEWNKREKRSERRRKKWKHNQAEFVTLQSDIWPFTTTIFGIGDRIPNVFAFAQSRRVHSHIALAHKLLFNYDICLLFHLWFVCVDFGRPIVSTSSHRWRLLGNLKQNKFLLFIIDSFNVNPLISCFQSE